MQRKRPSLILLTLAGATGLVLCWIIWGKRGSRLPAGLVIERLVVEKGNRRLLAYADGRLVKTYTVALGRNPVGHKQVEGDNKTPEGTYFIDGKNPNSRFHKNLGVSYPNDDDRAQARQLGQSPGGDIKIHGLPNGRADGWGRLYNRVDWTAGCVAVTNDEIDELYEAVAVGTSIEIRP